MDNICTYEAGIYNRLSQDDGNIGESDSIQTQKAMNTQWCEEHHIHIAGCYIDDGWSGTNFERPDFKRMIQDIENGKINMVVVKDLSRFGREYAQMGLYIEHYFEEKGVRFVSITENIDTLKGTDNLVFPFTNVLNSYQARQTSIKTKAAFQTRAKNGMFLGARAPFGYLKDPEDKHHLIIDPVASAVVRRIFLMYSLGIGLGQITKKLREDNVLNPQAYFNRNNPDFYKSDYWRKDFDWHVTSVRAILDNEVYLGRVVFGKTKTKGFYDKTRVPVPPEERIVVEGTHEAIISQEMWDTVHDMMKAKRRTTAATGEIHMFAGLVKCADCGSALNVSYDKKKGRYNGFSCWVYKNYGKNRCSSHAIGWVTLNNIVLTSIRTYAQIAAKYSDEYMAVLIAKSEAIHKQEIVKYHKELKLAQSRITDLDRIISKLYEDRALGKLSDARYEDMSRRYETEQAELKTKAEKMEMELSRHAEAEENAKQHIAHIKKYTEIEELNAQILNELIDKIVVHEKFETGDGEKYQIVDIHYKYVGGLGDGILEDIKGVNGVVRKACV